MAQITLIIGGGIAAYKSLELIRLMRKSGVDVIPVLTSAGAEFVTPLSVGALAERPPFQTLFDVTQEGKMGHITLSRASDLIVIAPATADFMAKMATGQADDLASTLVLATDAPVMAVPAMNVRMWEHPATQRNIAQLHQDGIVFCGPVEGAMACGEYGMGRMEDVENIAQAILAQLNHAPRPLAGRRAVVTSGPTHEPIDPVRYIANRSSGAQGTAIAQALMALGAEVVFVTGPATAPRPKGAQIIEVETAKEMQNAVERALERSADVAIFAAAVADYAVRSPATEKLKKEAGQGLGHLEFTQNPDILANVSQRQSGRPQLVIGFAAETEQVVDHATRKRHRKGCDWIVANDVSAETGIMGGSENQVVLITDTGAEPWPRARKEDVARQLAQRIAEHFQSEGS